MQKGAGASRTVPTLLLLLAPGFLEVRCQQPPTVVSVESIIIVSDTMFG